MLFFEIAYKVKLPRWHLLLKYKLHFFQILYFSAKFGMDCNRDRLQLSGLSLEHEPLNQEDDRKESFKVHKDVDDDDGQME